jgi:hypothetical protein
MAILTAHEQHINIQSRYQSLPLHRAYRYSTAYSGCICDGLTIQPIGLDDPREQNRFHIEINLISKLLFGLGAAGNTVYNAHGIVVFQHPDMAVNRKRAKQVTAKWRQLKRQDVDISAFYRENRRQPEKCLLPI